MGYSRYPGELLEGHLLHGADIGQALADGGDILHLFLALVVTLDVFEIFPGFLVVVGDCHGTASSLYGWVPVCPG